VYAHRIEVLDRADDDAVAGRVAHHLELVLLPALERAFDEHLPDGTGREAGLDAGAKLFRIAREASTRSAQREGRPHDRR
jgi:hypothetical protein